MFLTIGRTFKESIQGFMRNGWLAIATISVLILSLYVIGVSFVVATTANNILKDIQDKVNISAYFKSDVTEERMMEIKSNLESFSEIKSVEYVSKDSALEKFKRDNANQKTIMQSLEVIGENPLLASLVVKASNSQQYQFIVDYINKASFAEDISNVNYDKYKDRIDKLNGIIVAVRRVGIALGILFAVISLLITFNTIRITIYTHRQEIEIMRLVGASNFFIRLPFIFEGMIYGVVSSALSMLVLFLSVKFITPYVSSSIQVSNLVNVYVANFWILLGGQIILGSLLGIIGSLLAMHKYLKT